MRTGDRDKRRIRGRRLVTPWGLGAIVVVSAICCVDVPAPAGAASGSAICTGYASCNSSGHTSHGYDDTTNKTSYWGADPGHNCTNYVAYVESHIYKANDPGTGLGDAETWGLRAPSHGAVVDSHPSVGAVAWWDHNSPFGPNGGHVAIVESYTSASITVSEDNFRGNFDWRTYSTSGSPSFYPTGFIHFKGVSRPSLVWALTPDHKAYWYRGGKTWTHITDGWAQVDVGVNGQVYGVNTAGAVYWYRGGKTWTHIGNGFAQVSVGGDTSGAALVWALTPDHKAYWYRGGMTWTHITDGWAQVDVGVNGQVWGVNTAGAVYWYRGGKTWTHIGNGFAQVSVGGG
jgi:surface antigen